MDASPIRPVVSRRWTNHKGLWSPFSVLDGGGHPLARLMSDEGTDPLPSTKAPGRFQYRISTMVGRMEDGEGSGKFSKETPFLMIREGDLEKILQG